jgi:hypothetical protein
MEESQGLKDLRDALWDIKAKTAQNRLNTETAREAMDLLVEERDALDGEYDSIQNAIDILEKKERGWDDGRMLAQ